MCPQAVALDWWPVTRDCAAYGVTVVLLILTLRDGRVEWYEALLLVSVYLLYLLSEYIPPSHNIASGRPALTSPSRARLQPCATTRR